jgi:hypothetical protein
MFSQVAELFHDLDAGMLPVSVLFPYLPIPQHRRRDRCAPAAAGVTPGWVRRGPCPARPFRSAAAAGCARAAAPCDG